MKTLTQNLSQVRLSRHPGIYFFLLTLVMVLGIAWNLWFQQKAAQAQFQQQAKDIQQNAYLIDHDLKVHFETLIQYAHSSDYNEHTFFTLLNNTQKNLKLLYNTGIAVTFSPTSLKPLIEQKHQQGFENFQLKQQLLTPSFSQDAPLFQLTPKQIDHFTIITHTVPYTPEAQALLGEQLPINTASHQTLLVNLAHHDTPFFLHQIKLDDKWQLFHLIDTNCFFHKLLLSQHSEKLEASLQLQSNPPYPLSQTHPHPSDTFTLYTFQTTLPIQLLNQPLSFTLTQHWTLHDINVNTLISTLFITFITFTLFWWLVIEINRNYLELGGYKNRLQQLQTNSHDAIIITNQNGKILDWSPQAQKLFGYRSQEAVGRPLLPLLSLKTEADKGFDSFTDDLIKADTSPEYKLKNKSGAPLYARINTTPIEIEGKKEYFFFIQDTTRQRQQALQIHKMAYYDPLTGLENRTQFINTLEILLQQETHLKAALMFLDLDGFKQVNDTLGHEAGDEILKIVAQRLKGFISKNDRYHHLARFGGDEFLLFQPYEHTELLNKKAHAILQSLARPYRISKGTLTLSASLGIALHPQDGRTIGQLLRHADSAMYAAKGHGKNTFAYYDPTFEEKASELFQIENALKTAIQNDEFFLVYQPKIDTKTLKLSGFEALIRWIHPELGFVRPDKFIAIAEESHLIIDIGNWVIKTAIAQLQAWQTLPYLKNIPIAINLSSKQILDPEFFPCLQRTMEKAHLPPHSLELELTERSIMSNTTEHIERLKEAQALGFQFAVDDFGTGYSSLSYLKKFPIHTLKVDKSFVDGLPGDEDDQAISGTIITLAHSLKLKTVAEGVETETQFLWLKDNGCDTIQGYYFSKPLKASEIEEWWHSHVDTFLTHRPPPMPETDD